MISSLKVFPKPTVSVVIGTYGTDEWKARGERLADETQWPGLNFTEVIVCHADTLAEARNSGANEARGDWLVFLDADDFLSPSYLVEVALYGGTADILCPSVRGFRMVLQDNMDYDLEWLDPEPHLPKVTPLIKQNYLPIGAFIKYETFEQAGGFDDWVVLEDWAFWLECESNGATFGQIPEACYCINDDHIRSKHPESDQIARKIREWYR